MSCNSKDKTKNFRHKKLEIQCKKCSTCSMGSELLSYLSTIKQLHKQSKSKQTVDQAEAIPSNFKGLNKWIEKLDSNEQSPMHSKPKKIKKRGRKKWTSKHELILEGCVLIWGDDVSKIQKLLPEFNDNVIRKKLSHFMWKKYAVKNEHEENKVVPLNLEPIVISDFIVNDKNKKTECIKNDEFFGSLNFNENNFLYCHELSNDAFNGRNMASYRNQSELNFSNFKPYEANPDLNINQTSHNMNLFIESIADLSKPIDYENLNQVNEDQNGEKEFCQKLYQNSLLNLDSFGEI